MEPVLLVCGGCGVRIRTTDPAKARARTCPRCEMSLGPAVDRALGVVPELIGDRSPMAEAPTRPRSRVPVAFGLALIATLPLVVLMLRNGSDPGDSSQKSTNTVARTRPSVPESRPSPPKSESKVTVDGPDDLETSPDVPELTPPPTSAKNDLAILQPDVRDPSTILRPSDDFRSRANLAEQPPPPPTPSISSPAPTNLEPRRLVVRDRKGRAVVAREHGIVKDRLTVLLPDGGIGWLKDEIVTEKPFVPLTMDEMRRSLLDEPEYTTFRLLQTEHYLILYQSSTDTFARASGDLLEKLHGGLTAALRKNGLPVKPLEFPLVAVIFETEADFRANRQVPKDFQAYYEILSNRIYFYEKSKRDQDAPEVAALRKPQTVAHEGTHQILHNVGIQPRMSDWPLWLVEGLAEYCSPPKTTKRGVDWAGLGQVNPLHMATIRDLDDPLPNPFQGGRQPVIGRDRKTPLVEYLVTRKELTPTDYALAWALSHYLASKRPDDFWLYIKRMSLLKPGQEQSPQDQLAAFRDVFGNDLAQMDAKVNSHLKKVKQPDFLPYYGVIFEQQVGSMIHRQGMVSQSPSVIRQWIESISHPQGAEPRYEIIPRTTSKQAFEVVEQWMRQVR